MSPEESPRGRKAVEDQDVEQVTLSGSKLPTDGLRVCPSFHFLGQTDSYLRYLRLQDGLEEITRVPQAAKRTNSSSAQVGKRISAIVVENEFASN